MRNFLHSLISGLEVGSNRVRVGIVMYNVEPMAVVCLDTFKDKSELLDFIKILPYHGGAIRTGAALNFTLQEIFIPQRGSRKELGVQQVAVVITDAKAQDDIGTPASDLRRAGVTVYTVGFEGADKAQLDQIASYPTNKHMFFTANLSRLNTLAAILQRLLCQNVIQQAFSINTRRASIREGV